MRCDEIEARGSGIEASHRGRSHTVTLLEASSERGMRSLETASAWRTDRAPRPHHLYADQSRPTEACAPQCAACISIFQPKTTRKKLHWAGQLRGCTARPTQAARRSTIWAEPRAQRHQHSRFRTSTQRAHRTPHHATHHNRTGTRSHAARGECCVCGIYDMLLRSPDVLACSRLGNGLQRGT